MAQRAYELIDHFPPSYRTTVEANVRYFEGDWTETFRLLNTALDIDPDNKEALYLLSEIYFHSKEIGDHRKSTEIMEQLLTLDPDFVLVFRHLARCYTILDEREKFDRLIQIGEEKDLEDVATARSAWAADHGNIDEAMNLLDNARGNHVPSRLLFLALSTGQFELAADALKRAETEEGYPPHWLATDRAGLAAFTGQFDDALRLWSAAAPSWAIQPERVGGYDGELLAEAKLRRAEIFSLKGDFAAAESEIASVVDIFPNNFELLFWAGHYALEDNDPESVEVYRARLADLAEQARYPFLSLYVDFLEADIKLKQEDYAEARDLLLHVIDIYDYHYDAGHARILLSRAYLGLGQPEEAVDFLENIRPNYREAIVTFPHIRALFILGKLKLQLGDETAAREYLTRYLSYWGDADWDLEEVAEAKILLAQLEDDD
jgi:tetratricopeptide (TPR) repeat protein